MVYNVKPDAVSTLQSCKNALILHIAITEIYQENVSSELLLLQSAACSSCLYLHSPAWWHVSEVSLKIRFNIFSACSDLGRVKMRATLGRKWVICRSIYVYVSRWASCSSHTAIHISKGPSFLLKLLVLAKW